MITNTKLIEESLQFIKDQPSSQDELYIWASNAEIIIGDLCKALSAEAQPEREPLSVLELAEIHSGEGYAEYVELDVFVDIAREIENYYGITAQKEQR